MCNRNVCTWKQSGFPQAFKGSCACLHLYFLCCSQQSWFLKKHERVTFRSRLSERSLCACTCIMGFLWYINSPGGDVWPAKSIRKGSTSSFSSNSYRDSSSDFHVVCSSYNFSLDKKEINWSLLIKYQQVLGVFQTALSFVTYLQLQQKLECFRDPLGLPQ